MEPIALTFDDPPEPEIDLEQVADMIVAGYDRVWWKRAACRGLFDVFVVFPRRGTNDDMERSLGFCEVCPVRAECFATHYSEKEGVWGGTSGRVRRVLAKRLRALLRERKGRCDGVAV